MNIRKKDAGAILTALQGGVVPNRGLQYIMVGRSDEAGQILKELENVKKGASIIKFFIGPFGSGKTFIQSLIQQVSFKENFVVAKADFTPERRLYGSEGKAQALYTELMKNISIATLPEGNALPTILDKWIDGVLSKVASKKGYVTVEFENPEFLKDVEIEINSSVRSMDALTGGYDFGRILCLYFNGYVQDNQELQRNALRWLKGEYTTKTEARADLGVRNIINDSNYYEYIKVISQFVKTIGYSGLVLNFDEAINLYKMTHLQTRDKNYETILKIYNDTLQGNVQGLYITFGGTEEFIYDERRGLFSYEALKSRLQTNPFETAVFRDLTQPVINLIPLKHEETFVLLQKLREIHESYNDYITSVKDEEIKGFIQKEYSRPGAEANMTTRDVVRDFIGALNILKQNPTFERKQIFGEMIITEELINPIKNRFQKTAN